MFKLLRVVGVVGLALSAVMVLLVAWPAPVLRHAVEVPAAPPCVETPELRCFTVRDGARLAGHLESGIGGGPTILFLHGVSASGAELEPSAHALRAATGATVLRLDLRGHGLSAGAPGDLTHRWQYEEDVAEVLAALRREHPTTKLILAGHSMGGGIALATARQPLPIDALLLFAPLLGEGAPSTRHASAASQTNEAPVLTLLLPRLVGIGLLNLVGVHGFDARPVLFLDLPGAQRVRAYSFRAVASMAPDDLPQALTANELPLLTVVGEHDEAFDARGYPEVMAQHRNATTRVIAGATHEGVLVDPAALEAVGAWLASLR